jgi:hypothetical protein
MPKIPTSPVQTEVENGVISAHAIFSALGAFIPSGFSDNSVECC